MNGAPLLLRDENGRTLPPPRANAANDAPVAAWLRRSLSRQYDAVLAEELPPAMIALARAVSGEH